jgi:hypothetical protein
VETSILATMLAAFAATGAPKSIAASDAATRTLFIMRNNP